MDACQSLRACDVCRNTDTADLPSYSKGAWKIVRCSVCRFVFLLNPPGYDALEEAFAWERTKVDERRRRLAGAIGRLSWMTRWRLTVFDQFRRTPRLRGRVLDVGCGAGCKMAEGPTPFGLEISKLQADQARPVFEKRGGRVVQGPAIEGFDAFEENFFDAILMRSYLEHEQQPHAVLTKAYSRLAPGGIVYLRVPNFNSVNRFVLRSKWCGFRFPDHVNYFTSGSLRRLAESIGFTYRRANRFSPFDDNLIVELRKPFRGSTTSS